MLIYRYLVDNIDFGAVLQTLLLLAAANSAPVIAKKLLGQSLSYPLDGGFAFVDGRPIFGPSKTIRGIVCAVTASSLCAIILGFAWTTGLILGLAAMAGDLISSFIKRRLGFPPSSMALGLDQIPESLLPALASLSFMTLTAGDVVLIVALFFAGELVLSRLLFSVDLRDQPY